MGMRSDNRATSGVKPADAADAREGGASAMGRFEGVVLAGGESRRMGCDKALLRLGGELWWRRQIRVLQEAGAKPVAVVRREGQAVLGRDVRTLHDVFTDVGPLAGLHVALSNAKLEWVAVLAVDMLAVEPDWFVRLGGMCGTGVGAVAHHRFGYEPLAAIYSREALTAVERALAEGKKSLQDLVKGLVRARRMNVFELPETQRGCVANWNTPDASAAGASGNNPNGSRQN